jgi:hypothetical protein
MNKRHKIIITSSILPLVLLSTWFVPISIYVTYKFFFIGGLAVMAYLLSLWSLWEGMTKLKAVTLMILPTLFTLAMASYFFLLPVRWLAFPVAIIFGLIFYTLLLSQNVFNVASMRTIPLYRVASTTVFVLTLITSFVLFNVIYSLNMLFIWNGVVVFLLSFPLILQVLWSIEMEGLTGLILVYTTVISLIIGELALALSFWPIFHPMASLMLSTALFITMGISTHVLRDRSSRSIVWEYVAWGILIFIIAVLTTSWNG